MNVNKKVIDILKEYSINPDDGLTYLFSIYFGLKPTIIPDNLKYKINVSKIIEVEKGIIKWNIPLFEGQETNFQWVIDEYIKLFKEVNDQKGGHKKESIIRMKKFFAEYPDIRKDDVIEATKLYLANTDMRYIRYPHYFISKGRGVEKTSDLATWVDKYRALNKVKELKISQLHNTLK